ncbi:MAG TPA: galactose oxidase early set domain-containing protein, partial [Gemmatimonadales bacterium]
PNGTVLHGASGDAAGAPRQASHEIFRPPYLFKGTRPVISSLSSLTVGYGGQITVNTPHAKQITAVRWIKLGSVTHAFDAGQRANSLTFTRGSGFVRVTVPSNSRRATPGYYVLFILNRNGVPSVGSVVRVG